jgi:hypothetical protein
MVAYGDAKVEGDGEHEPRGLKRSGRYSLYLLFWYKNTITDT